MGSKPPAQADNQKEVDIGSCLSVHCDCIYPCLLQIACASSSSHLLGLIERVGTNGGRRKDVAVRAASWKCHPQEALRVCDRLFCSSLNDDV